MHNTRKTFSIVSSSVQQQFSDFFDHGGGNRNGIQYPNFVRSSSKARNEKENFVSTFLCLFSVDVILSLRALLL